MPDFNDFYRRYPSVTAIKDDPHLPLYAKAAGMTTLDFCNHVIKQFIIHRALLEQSVIVAVKSTGTITPTLLVDETGNPVKYKKVLTDRSGPKFASYLYQLGTDYLQSSPAQIQQRTTRTRLVAEHVERIIETYETSADTVDSDVIAGIRHAATALSKDHFNQRKLSDYDMMAFSLAPLIGPIIKLLLDYDIDGLDLVFVKEIAQTMWEKGGPIDIDFISQHADSYTPGCYRRHIAALLQQQLDKDYTHPLLTATRVLEIPMQTGQQVFPEGMGVVCRDYGLGFEFQAKYVVYNDEGELIWSEDTDEAGDVIVDKFSHLAFLTDGAELKESQQAFLNLLELYSQAGQKVGQSQLFKKQETIISNDS